MTSFAIRDAKNDNLLTPENCALAIIDVQPIQVSSLGSMDKGIFIHNIAALAKTAKTYRLPTVLSTVNVESGRNKPMIKQVTDVFGNELPIYDRTTLNAWEDKEFRAALEATGRKKIIIGALWTEVCLAFPSLDLLKAGYEVYPVVDCCGSMSMDAHRAGLDRIVQAGGQPVSWTSVICELQRDWARGATVEGFVKTLFDGLEP